MDNQELKLCPFCGGKDLHLHERPSKDKTITWYHLHHGPTTRCSITMMDSDKATLLERWNKRSVGNKEDGTIDVISGSYSENNPKTVKKLYKELNPEKDH